MATVRTGFASDIGRYREVNEDSLFTGRHVFAVADGMGGHAAGDVASALAVARLDLLDRLAVITPDDVRATLAAANRDIVNAGTELAGQVGMGTTMTGIALVRFAGADHWMVFNVGDSRVYRLADGSLTQISVDHSEVAEMVAQGRISPDEALNHPRGNVVTRVLGAYPPSDVDVWLFPTAAPERFLLCSDGLTKELRDRDIAAVLTAEPDPRHAATQLIRQALQAGGRDNITVVVVDHVATAPSAAGTRDDEDTLPRLRSES